MEMAGQQTWIKTRIEQSRNLHPVTDAVSTHLETLLLDKFTEKQVPLSELSTIALSLIAEMSPIQPAKDASAR